jgi:REP element-mobilizing transposase RayT
MENHLHFIAASKELRKELGDFKSFTARKIIDLLEERKSAGPLELLERYKLNHKKDRQYQLWQEGSHPEEIISEEMMIKKIEYIHNNPVRRGYVDNPTDWRYSSAGNYEGKEGLIAMKTEW